MVMSVSAKILRYFFICTMIVMITACAPAKKNPFYEKRKKNSYVNASQLGKNKYYFSKDYQKKLNNMYKKK
jgi:hypothetical protein